MWFTLKCGMVVIYLLREQEKSTWLDGERGCCKWLVAMLSMGWALLYPRAQTNKHTHTHNIQRGKRKEHMILDRRYYKLPFSIKFDYTHVFNLAISYDNECSVVHFLLSITPLFEEGSSQSLLQSWRMSFSTAKDLLLHN